MKEREIIDLSLGQPDFLRPYWVGRRGSQQPNLGWGMRYQHEAARPDLVETIVDLHQRLENCSTDGKAIVIGNGIRHLVIAAIRAQSLKSGRTRVFAEPPNFFLFEDMVASLGNVSFENEPGGFDPDVMLNIMTSPSNPINMRGQGEIGPFNVWDLCYNWPQYGDIACFSQLGDSDVQVFGLAKATGHAGTRLGWAVVGDLEIASMMQQFIRNTTGGVSVEAQVRAVDIINDQLECTLETVFEWGRRVIDGRWTELHHAGLMVPGHKSGLHVVNVSGAFAWCEYSGYETDRPLNAASSFEDHYGIKVLPGELCYPGATNMLRINLGCSETEFQVLTERLQAAG